MINMPKKIQAFLLCTLLIVSCVPFFPKVTAAQTAVAYASEEDFEVKYENGYAYIIGYNGSDKSVAVPPSFSSYPLDGICKRAFYKCDIESVTLPEPLSQISDEAFAECSSLTDIAFPSTVTYIGKGVFRACTSLEQITLPSVKEICDFTFFNCTSLSSVSLPSSLTKIGMRAFFGCAFEEISLPDTVTDIGKYAFSECKNLKNISVSDTNTSYNMNPPLLASGNEAVYVPEGISGEYTIDGVKSVRRNAFYNTSLTKIVISDSVTTLCDRAFYGSSSLEYVLIPESVTSFGYDVFGQCENLTVYCYNDSAALTYATENGINYEIIEKTYEPGDVNGDGKINIYDVLLLDAYVHNKTSDIYTQPADVNGDGTIDTSDVIKLVETVKNPS